jgi:hypothetical protein
MQRRGWPSNVKLARACSELALAQRARYCAPYTWRSPSFAFLTRCATRWRGARPLLPAICGPAPKHTPPAEAARCAGRRLQACRLAPPEVCRLGRSEACRLETRVCPARTHFGGPAPVSHLTVGPRPQTCPPWLSFGAGTEPERSPSGGAVARVMLNRVNSRDQALGARDGPYAWRVRAEHRRPLQHLNRLFRSGQPHLRHFPARGLLHCVGLYRELMPQ